MERNHGSRRNQIQQKIAGDKSNYQWGARFDVTGRGYVGITQFDGGVVKDRVLLSPKQVSELVAFVGRKK